MSCLRCTHYEPGCWWAPIEAEVTISGVEQPDELNIGRSERRMFHSGVSGQEVDLAARDPTSVLVREAIYKEIDRLRRRHTHRL